MPDLTRAYQIKGALDEAVGSSVDVGVEDECVVLSFDQAERLLGTTGNVTYSPHHFGHVEGHLFFDVPDGPCTITLTPAASADQAWLDERGRRIARLLNGEH